MYLLLLGNRLCLEFVAISVNLVKLPFAVCRIPNPAVVSSDAPVSVSETTIEDVDVCDEPVTEMDLTVSSARVSVSEETTTKDVDVCEESEIDVDVPVVVPSDALESISEETIPEDVDVCEESENVMDIPDAVSSAKLVFVSEETSMDVDVCEKSEISMECCRFRFVTDEPSKGCCSF